MVLSIYGNPFPLFHPSEKPRDEPQRSIDHGMELYRPMGT